MKKEKIPFDDNGSHRLDKEYLDDRGQTWRREFDGVSNLGKSYKFYEFYNDCFLYRGQIFSRKTGTKNVHDDFIKQLTGESDDEL